MTRSTIAKPRPKAKARSSSNQIRNYRSALNYLDTLINYERTPLDAAQAKKFTLSRMNKLLSALGNPHKAFRSAHVAGTKGKGSTCVMLAEMLRACDMKVGLYTSPHILDIRERIVVDGSMIPSTAFGKVISEVAQAVKAARIADPTFFEVMTAAAFLHFATSGVKIAVLETGLGGRLDCTNVVNPDVVGITSISYDHMQALGSNLVDIAREKAGIIKKGIPVVCSPQRPEVKQVIKEAAATAGAPIVFSSEDVDFSCRFEFSRAVGRHTRICLTTATSRFEHLHVPLLGEHQATNCGVALNMLDQLKARGFDIDDQKAMAGLANVSLAGRMEVVHEHPRIIVDGAHNAASIDALMRAIGQNISYDSMVVIFGCQKDKDISGMIRRIQLGADKIVFTRSTSSQAADPHELAAEYTEHSGKPAQVAESLVDALRIAQCAVSKGDIICITGSFYLVGDAKRLLTPATVDA